MTTRSKWLSLAISFGVMLSLVIMTVATASAAKNGSKSHGKSHAKAAAACKKIKAKGTIRFSDWQFPDNLNAAQSQSAASAEVYYLMNTYDVLYDQSAHLIPVGLTKVPTPQNGLVKNGGKTIVLQLRPNQHWNNGALETSADIKFAWRVGMDKASGPACTGTCDVIKSITTPSRYTAVLNLKKVFAPAVPSAFPGELPLSWPGGWKKGDAHTAATKLYQDASWNFESNRFPMNGPYVPTEFSNNNRIILKPNKHFRRGNVCGAPTASYKFAFYSNQQAMIDAAAVGATDITNDYTAADLASLRKGQSAHHKYKIKSIPGFFFEHFEMNHDARVGGASNPFSKVKVRLAVALVLNKVQIAQGALTLNKSDASRLVAWSPWVNTGGLTQAYANKSVRGVWDPYGGARHKGAFVQPGTRQAIKDAQKLMKSAGYAHGFTFDHWTTTAPFRQASAAIMASQLRKALGVTMTPHFVPGPTRLFATWQENGVLVRGTFQTAEFAYIGGPESNDWRFEMECKHIARRSPTPEATLHRNDAGICNRTIDSDFNKGAGTLDPSARAKYYGQIQSILAKEADWDPLYFRPVIETAANNIRNFKVSPVGTEDPVWNWWELKKAG